MSNQQVGEDKIVSQREREEIFCALKTLANSTEKEFPEKLQVELKKLLADPTFQREFGFQQNTDNTTNINCFLKKVFNDPQAISFGLNTVANVGTLAAFIILYKKYNNRQKVNQILALISAFSTWGIYAHQLVRKNSCSNC